MRAPAEYKNSPFTFEVRLRSVFKSVDFPEPLCPMMEVTSPPST
jgi:hypothetical protein